MKKLHTSNQIPILKNLGLSEKEALIYLAALETGGCSIAELAQTAQIERTGIYYYIEKLIKQKLLKPVARGKRTIYLPADPEKLKDLSEILRNQFNRIFPTLQETFSQHGSKSFIEYFQGKEELNKFYDRLYQILCSLSPEENLVYILGTSYRNVVDTGPDFLNYTKPKNKINVVVKAILPKWQKSKDPKENAMDPYIVERFNLPRAQLKYIEDKYQYPGAIVVTTDRVIQIDYKNMTYSVTANKNLATTWRMFFEYIWHTLK